MIVPSKQTDNKIEADLSGLTEEQRENVQSVRRNQDGTYTVKFNRDFEMVQLRRDLADVITENINMSQNAKDKINERLKNN